MPDVASAPERLLVAPRALAALSVSADLERISVSDLLRGLIAQGGGVAAKALSASGATDWLLNIADKATPAAHSKHAWIAYAASEAERRTQFYVATEHLLLAVLSELRSGDPEHANGIRSLRGQVWRALIEISQGNLRIPAGPGTPMEVPAAGSVLDPVMSDEPVVGASYASINDGGAVVSGWADLAAERPVNPQTRFRVGSITKIATTLLVLRLVDERELHLDQPATDRLTSLRLTDRHGDPSPATIRQLLTHTAGLPHGSGLHRPGEPIPLIPQAFPDGIRAENDIGAWSYSNLGFVVLAQLAADVLHTSFAQAAQDVVLTPLGLRESVIAPDLPHCPPYPMATGYGYDRQSFIPIRDVGVVAQGAGELVATATDTAKLIATTIRDDYLTKETRAELVTPHIKYANNTWQGLGVRIRRRNGYRLIGHDGSRPGFQAAAVVCPEIGKSAGLLTNTDTRPVSPYLEELLLPGSSARR